jgi:alkyl hydroperoxide reductase subunit AhpC
MIATNVNSTATVRNVFIIDDKGIVKCILVYPLNVRKKCIRNFENSSKFDKR